MFAEDVLRIDELFLTEDLLKLSFILLLRS